MVYGHVNSNLKKGTKVKNGQTIAYVKDWGDRTHLHLERRMGSGTGTAVNPSGYLNSLQQQSNPKVTGTVTGYGKVGNAEYFYANGKYWQREGGKLSVIDAQSYAAIRTNHAQDFGITPGTDANKLKLPGGGYRDPKNYQASVTSRANTGDIASLNYTPSYDEVGVTKIMLITLKRKFYWVS